MPSSSRTRHHAPSWIWFSRTCRFQKEIFQEIINPDFITCKAGSIFGSAFLILGAQSRNLVIEKIVETVVSSKLADITKEMPCRSCRQSFTRGEARIVAPSRTGVKDFELPLGLSFLNVYSKYCDYFDYCGHEK